jgi:hypothetical protein
VKPIKRAYEGGIGDLTLGEQILPGVELLLWGDVVGLRKLSAAGGVGFGDGYEVDFVGLG